LKTLGLTLCQGNSKEYLQMF